MNECRSWVYEPRRSKIGSSKEIVGECKYLSVTSLKCLTPREQMSYLVGLKKGSLKEVVGECEYIKMTCFFLYV